MKKREISGGHKQSWVIITNKKLSLPVLVYPLGFTNTLTSCNLKCREKKVKKREISDGDKQTWVMITNKKKTTGSVFFSSERSVTLFQDYIDH